MSIKPDGQTDGQTPDGDRPDSIGDTLLLKIQWLAYLPVP